MKRRMVLTLTPLLLGVGGCGYNQIQKYDENAAQAKQQISVQLQRRADLVPNLVNTVKGYAQHEEAVFTQVAQARAGLAGAIQSGDPQQMATANAGLTGAQGRLIAIAEAYPQLKSDQGFLKLQDELAGTENRIAVSRQVYNDSVLTYNNAIQTFPGVVLAGPFGFAKREFFETDETQREAPRVDFSPGAGTAAPSVTPPAAPAAPAAPSGDAPSDPPAS